MTDSSQATTATKAYDAFGNLIGTSGSTTTPFGFAGGFGYETDAESGLLLLGHRNYDPSTGRFITRDLTRDGRNWYAYAGANPTGNCDPSGLTLDSITSNPETAAWALEEINGIAGEVEAGGIWDQLFGKLLGLLGAVAIDVVVSYDHGRERLQVGRIGSKYGQYWAPVDPRTDPDYYKHYGMKHSDNPGAVVTIGYVTSLKLARRGSQNSPKIITGWSWEMATGKSSSLIRLQRSRTQ